MNEDSRSLSDEELVFQSLKEEQFFSILISRYKEKFFYYLKRFAGLKDDDIEDVVQASFIKIYYHLNSFDQKLKFSSWAYRIVHNEAIDELRRRKRSALPLLDEFDIPDDFCLEDEVDRVLEKKKVAMALGDLKQKHRELLFLRYFEHKEYKEISDILQKPLGTVCASISRAKKQFKIKYEKYAG